MSDKMISCSDLIMRTVNITPLGENELPSVWKRVVSKIKSYTDNEDNERRIPLGERLAGNTRVIDLKKGVLLIESDHPGWIQYLRLYQKFIIKGLKMELPDLVVNSMAFRLTGSTFGLSDDYDEELKKAQDKQQQAMKKTESELEEFYKGQGDAGVREELPKSELPQELLDKFNSIRKSIEEEENQ